MSLTFSKGRPHNKWESQYIQKKNRKRRTDHWERSHKKAFRCSNSLSAPRRLWSGWNQKLTRKLHRIECMSFDKQLCNDILHEHAWYDQHPQDYQYAIQRSIIPVWNCTRCTYRNIEREDHCKMCHHAYSVKHDDDESSSFTLGDFVDDDSDHYEDDIFWVGLERLYDASKPSGNNKLMASINNGEFGVIPKCLKQKILKYKVLKRATPKLRSLQRSVKSGSNDRKNISVKCLMTDHWLRKLQHSDIQLLYTQDISHWNSKQHMGSFGGMQRYQNYEQILKELLLSDEIVMQCGIDSLLYGYTRQMDAQLFIPTDVMFLCLLYIGMMDKLLPYNLNRKINNNIDNYLLRRNSGVRCSALHSNAMRWLPLWRSRGQPPEIYLCASLLPISDHEQTFSMKYNVLLPLISITTEQATNLSRTAKGYSGGHKKQRHVWHQLMYSRGGYGCQRMYREWNQYCNGGIFRDIEMNILKFEKLRDPQRRRRRKWSALYKLNRRYR